MVIPESLDDWKSENKRCHLHLGQRLWSIDEKVVLQTSKNVLSIT